MDSRSEFSKVLHSLFLLFFGIGGFFRSEFSKVHSLSIVQIVNVTCFVLRNSDVDFVQMATLF